MRAAPIDPKPAPPAHRRRVPTRRKVALAVGAVAVVVATVAGVTAWPSPPPDRTTGQPFPTGAMSAPGPTPATPRPSPTPGLARTATSSPGCVGCPAEPPFSAPAGKRWRLSFAEEFNGAGYDRTKLTPCFDWNYGGCTSSFNNGREHYQPSQVKVSGGTARLIAAPLSPPLSADGCQGGSCTYKSGLLATARPNAGDGSDYLYAFRYGYVESRLKFPATRGFFTAFWLLPANRAYTYRSEIDILEVLGDDPTTMFMTYHYRDRASSYAVNKGKFHNGACPVRDYADGFVRMGVDWQPHRIAWYIDGRKCAEFTDRAAIENGPMQIIINMMVDNDWQRQWRVGLTDPRLVRQLEVDYLRVYQQVPA
jgi:hypothetical protein